MKKLFVCTLFLLTACTPITEPVVETLPVDSNSDWYTVYFSEPGGPNAETQRGGPDAALADAIGQARASVDVAIYDLNLWSIRDALLDAHRRGVQVRVVAEADNLDSPELQELIAAGIPLIDDRNQNLMHNKFVVIDRFEVWTGSMNFTLNGAYRNDNNLIRIRSSRLAENYLAEFEEMFTDTRFGSSSPANTPNPDIAVEGTRIETYFSPDDGVADRIVELVEGAEKSVFFMAFSFTSDDIANAMLFAVDGGVELVGIFDSSQYSSNIGTEFDRLLDAGQNVHLDGNSARLHHKVIIIDESIVITGSYNFSRNAEERNDENLLIIHSPEIAALFVEEFKRVFFVAVE